MGIDLCFAAEVGASAREISHECLNCRAETQSARGSGSSPRIRRWPMAKAPSARNAPSRRGELHGWPTGCETLPGRSPAGRFNAAIPRLSINTTNTMQHTLSITSFMWLNGCRSASDGVRCILLFETVCIDKFTCLQVLSVSLMKALRKSPCQPRPYSMVALLYPDHSKPGILSGMQSSNVTGYLRRA